MKQEPFQTVVMSILLYNCTTWTNILLIQAWRKRLMGTIQGCCMLFWTNPGSSTSQNSSCTAPYLPSQTIQERWAKYTGHSCKDIFKRDILLWTHQCEPTSCVQYWVPFREWERQMVGEHQRNQCCQYPLMIMMITSTKLPNSFIKNDKTEFLTVDNCWLRGFIYFLKEINKFTHLKCQIKNFYKIISIVF